MLTPATSAMRLVLARSKPSLTKMRAVASIRASTVARDLVCEACFLGVVSGLRAMSCAPNASTEYERSLVLCPTTPRRNVSGEWTDRYGSRPLQPAGEPDCL